MKKKRSKDKLRHKGIVVVNQVWDERPLIHPTMMDAIIAARQEAAAGRNARVYRVVEAYRYKAAEVPGHPARTDVEVQEVDEASGQPG